MQHPLRGDGGIEHQREFEFFQQIEDGFRRFRRQPGMAAREEDRRPQAQRDRFAVQHLAVRHRRLDPVADGVAEVEQGADAFGFKFVRFDDAGLDGDVPGDQFRRDFPGRGVQRGDVRQHGGVADGGVLDDLGEAFPVFAAGQGGEHIGIDDDPRRLVERA